MRNGFKLRIKLHPNSLKEELNNNLFKLGIDCIDKNQFIEVLNNSRYVISEASSVTSIACLIGIPLITPTLKPFNEKKYGLMINSYPNRLSFRNFNEIEEIFNDNNIEDKKIKVQKWIDEFAGPLPPSDFSKRVFNIIKSIT